MNKKDYYYNFEQKHHENIFGWYNLFMVSCSVRKVPYFKRILFHFLTWLFYSTVRIKPFFMYIVR